MEPTSEQLDLIKSCIVQNALYNKKFHRIGEIANLVYEKASLFLNSISNEKTLRKYIDKTVGEILQKTTVKTSIENIQEQQEIFVEKTAEPAPPVLEPEPPAPPVELAVEESPVLETEPEILEPPAPEPEPEPLPEPESELPVLEPESPAPPVEFALEEPSEPTALEPEIPEPQELVPLPIEPPAPEPEPEPPAPPAPAPEPEPEIPALPEAKSEYDFLKELELLEDVSQGDEPQVQDTQGLIPTEPLESMYGDIEDPIVNVKTKRISKELTEKIIDIVLMAQKEEPEKQYSKIFYSKYVKKMKQSQIARELGISEEELCSRYLKLVRIVKREIG